MLVSMDEDLVSMHISMSEIQTMLARMVVRQEEINAILRCQHGNPDEMTVTFPKTEEPT
jgi:hypothetical protein